MANNFPNLKPALNLDLVNGIYVDSRVTFTRAGTRTYFGQEMVKAEENLVLYSQDLSQWTNQGVTLVSGKTAPDGTSTAFSVTAASGNQRIFISPSVVSGVIHTISVFMRRVVGTGTITFRSPAGADINVTAEVTSSWSRVVITGTSSGSSINVVVGVQTIGDEIEVWGAQLEQRSFATAYTPTTTQPITNYQRLLKTAAANEWPREFDPVTGECLGRSVWESRTNLLQRSEEFDNAYWTKDAVTITANTIVAPDGTLTGDFMRSTSATSLQSIKRLFTGGWGGLATFSIYVKAGGARYLSLRLPDFKTIAYYDLQDGLSSAPYGSATASITPVGNNWYRCVYSATLNSSATFTIALSDVFTGTTTSYTGDGYSGIYIWGAQLEAGAFATPYIPTVAAQVTRLADSAVMTGVNFSSWFNPSEGTLFVESQSATGATQNRAVYITDGTTSNYIGNVVNSTASSSGQVVRGGSVQAGFTSDATSGVFYKQALSYKTNDFAFCGNGGAVSTDDSGIIPIVNRVLIGGLLEGGLAGSGYIKRITYYNQALTSANLQAITR
jgi:hypothetical protein